MAKLESQHSVYFKELKVAMEAAEQAATLLRAEAKREGGPRGGGSKMPVDNEMEKIICDHLGKHFPEDNIFAEEEVMQKGVSKRAFWIDPHDGTSEFLKGRRETSISIGLIDNGELVMGVVYAPLIDSSYSTTITKPEEKAGMWGTWAKGQLHTEKNLEESKSPTKSSKSKKIIVSTSLSASRLDFVKEKLGKEFEVISCASIATRLALVAVGDAAATFTFHNLSPWDFAAGQALLIGSGGNLYDLSNKTEIAPISWKELHPSHNPQGYVGTCDPQLVPLLQKLLA